MLTFLFNILPGRCEFTPAFKGKTSDCAYFFWRGLHREWNLFWNTQREYYKMKAVNVEEEKIGTFLDFFKIFLFKHFFWHVQIHFVNIYRFFNYLGGIFWSRTVLVCSVAHTKKKYAISEVSTHKISPNWTFKRAETTVSRQLQLQ